jgi:hypothetical protein
MLVKNAYQSQPCQAHRLQPATISLYTSSFLVINRVSTDKKVQSPSATPIETPRLEYNRIDHEDDGRDGDSVFV